MIQFIVAILKLITGHHRDPEPAPAPKPQLDFAARIIEAMIRKGYRVDRGPGQVNIVYVEGINPDGSRNGNTPNQFNDLRTCIVFEQGRPRFAGVWVATTEPSKRWTVSPMNPKGAARIKFGQYTAWKVGHHKGDPQHEALVQVREVTVHRDYNKDYKRDGDAIDRGLFGINEHHGYNLPVTDLGTSSAGCLVGRTVSGHREFMEIVKSDPRYLADKNFIFSTTIMPAEWVA